MNDKFSDLEEPRSKLPMIVIIVFSLMIIVFVYRLLTSTSDPLQGKVESIDPVKVTGVDGAIVEDVSVRLTDGSVVIAQATSNHSLHVGDEVRVIVLPASATGPAYEAIAKRSRN